MVGPSSSESMAETSSSEGMVEPYERMVGSRDPSESMVESSESTVGPSESMVADARALLEHDKTLSEQSTSHGTRAW